MFHSCPFNASRVCSSSSLSYCVRQIWFCKPSLLWTDTKAAHKIFCLLLCWSSFPLCSPSCFEGRCVWMWRKRRRERCASARPAAAETTVVTWGATTEAPEAPEASWEAECSANATAGGRHLEVAWPRNLAWAPGEAPEAKEKVALLPSAAEKSAPRSVEVVSCFSSSTVLANETKSSCSKHIWFIFCFFFVIFCSLFALECDTACQLLVCEIDKTKWANKKKMSLIVSRASFFGFLKNSQTLMFKFVEKRSKPTRSSLPH